MAKDKKIKSIEYNVCGHQIKAIYTKKLLLDGDDCWGVYNDDARTLMLRYGMDKCRKAEVFLHEILHAISFIHGFDLSEKATNVLAIELVAFIRSNKLPLLKRLMK